MLKATTVKLNMSELTRELDDEKFTALLAKGYTVFSQVVVREEGIKYDELLLIMRPPVDDPQLARVEAKLDELAAPRRVKLDEPLSKVLLVVMVVTPWLLVALQAAGLL